MINKLYEISYAFGADEITLNECKTLLISECGMELDEVDSLFNELAEGTISSSDCATVLTMELLNGNLSVENFLEAANSGAFSMSDAINLDLLDQYEEGYIKDAVKSVGKNFVQGAKDAVKSGSKLAGKAAMIATIAGGTIAGGGAIYKHLNKPSEVAAPQVQVETPEQKEIKAAQEAQKRLNGKTVGDGIKDGFNHLVNKVIDPEGSKNDAYSQSKKDNKTVEDAKKKYGEDKIAGGK